MGLCCGCIWHILCPGAQWHLQNGGKRNPWTGWRHNGNALWWAAIEFTFRWLLVCAFGGNNIYFFFFFFLTVCCKVIFAGKERDKFLTNTLGFWSMKGSSYCIVATPVSVKVTTWPLHHAVLKGDLSADFQYGLGQYFQWLPSGFGKKKIKILSSKKTDPQSNLILKHCSVSKERRTLLHFWERQMQ